MILRATIGRRCVCRVIFFFPFLTYSPFCSPNISFYPFTPFNGTGTTKFGTKSFLYFFGFHLRALMNYWSFSLWTCTLIMDLSGIFLTEPMAFPCPYFLSLLSPSLPVSLLYLNISIVFSCFCVFAFLYRCMKCVQVPCGLVDVDVSQ
jgi:hypothetical protein